MTRQYFRELLEPIMVASQAQITGTTEAALWPVSPFTATAANQLRPDQVWSVTAWGVMTTAGAAPGTLIVTPRFGTSSSGVALGASGTSATMATSQTGMPWFLQMSAVVRSVGTSGVIVAGGVLNVPASVLASSLVFGGTVATIDTTAAGGFWVAATLGAAGDLMTTQGVAMELLN